MLLHRQVPNLKIYFLRLQIWIFIWIVMVRGLVIIIREWEWVLRMWVCCSLWAEHWAEWCQIRLIRDKQTTFDHQQPVKSILSASVTVYINDLLPLHQQWKIAAIKRLCVQGWSEFWPGGFYHLVKTGLNHLIKPTKTGQKWSKLKFHWFLKKIEKNLVTLWLFKVLIDVFCLLIFNLSDFFPVIVSLPTSIIHVCHFEKSYFDTTVGIFWWFHPF